MPVKYDQDTKAKAIRLVREHAGDYPTQWAAITAVSASTVNDRRVTAGYPPGRRSGFRTTAHLPGRRITPGVPPSSVLFCAFPDSHGRVLRRCRILLASIFRFPDLLA